MYNIILVIICDLYRPNSVVKLCRSEQEVVASDKSSGITMKVYMILNLCLSGILFVFLSVMHAIGHRKVIELYSFAVEKSLIFVFNFQACGVLHQKLPI